MLTTAEIISESFERCGIDSTSVQHEHLVSARRSLNLLFSEIYAQSYADEDFVDLVRTSVNIGQRVIVLDEDTLDVLDVVSVPDGSRPRPLTRMTRQDELFQDGAQAGSLSAYWVAKTGLTDLDLQEQPTGGWGQGSVGYGAVGGVPAGAGSAIGGVGVLTNKPLLILWPTPDAVTPIRYNRLRIPAQVTANLAARPDFRSIWMEAICAGLSARLAVKFAPGRLQALKGEWLEQKQVARIETRERGPVTFSGRGFGHAGRRRRF